MSYTVRQVKQFAEENDVKFVKLTFCDMQGKQKNISLVAEELDSAFRLFRLRRKAFVSLSRSVHAVRAAVAAAVGTSGQYAVRHKICG